MKKGWKIFLWIVGILALVVILGVLYGLFIFKLKVVNCVDSKNPAVTEVTCSSDSACFDYIKASSEKDRIQTLGQLSGSEFANQITDDIVRKISYCDGVCKVRNMYSLEIGNENQDCNEGEEKFIIGLNGAKLAKVYLAGECTTDADCTRLHPDQNLTCSDKFLSKWCAW